MRLAPPACKLWAQEHELPVEQYDSLRGEGVVDRIVGYDPQTIVVASYGLLLPPELLAAPPYGCVNVHASLLPRHRGTTPVVAAMRAGDPVTGVTTMLMDEGLDTGPILMQRPVSVRPRDTSSSLTARIFDAGAVLVLETLAGLESGELEPIEQVEADATFTRSLRREDGRLDWQQAALQLDRDVRALQPWPCAWTLIDGMTIKIWSCRPEPIGTDPPVEPGTITSVDREGIVVACGDGDRLRVLELQRPGKKRLSTADFLSGVRVAPGTVLDADAPASVGR